MTDPIVEGFSVSHAAILNGTTGAEEADIYGVREGKVEVKEGSYDNTGDDAVLSQWTWFDYAKVTIMSGFIPFDMIALITGETVTSSGADPDEHFEVALWTETSLNQPTRPLLVRVPSKTKDGVNRVLDFVLYKVHFDPIKFDGPSYKNGLTADYSGTATLADNDETATPLTTRAIGRLISKPAS